jgi:hydrogen peroxide-dependent heme synthase
MNVNVSENAETPQTLDGHYVLHDGYTFLWSAWGELSAKEREDIAGEAAEWLRDEAGVGETYSALFSMMGHKSDIMLVHYRSKIDALNRTERGWKRLRLSGYLRSTYSYFSVIEASLYEAVAIAQRKVATKGLTPDQKDYSEAFEKELAKEKKVLEGRVLRTIPEQRYLCFYPMNKRRGEHVNWYNLSTEERRQFMRGHGKVGHKYAREVTQVIGGSIGFDDYEWGVSLHSNDPLAIKRLITEMRFDPASSLYAEFGPFYFGIRQQPTDLPLLLAGGLA